MIKGTLGNLFSRFSAAEGKFNDAFDSTVNAVADKVLPLRMALNVMGAFERAVDKAMDPILAVVMPKTTQRIMEARSKKSDPVSKGPDV